MISLRAACLSLFLGMMITLPLYGDPKSEPDPGQQKPKETEADKWMQIKLHSSQEILAGLTNADFKKIESQSRRLLVLNFLENWRRENSFVKESEYQKQLNSFEFATKELIRTAGAKEINGALDAYVLLTRSCVECHKLIRDIPQAN